MAIWWIVASLGRRPPRGTPRPTNAGAATALFLSAFHVTMLMAFIGGQPWLVRMLGVLVGVFLIATGNDSPRVRPTLALGFRMRQTLASDSLWRRVHRPGGFVRVTMGIAVGAGRLCPAQMPFRKSSCSLSASRRLSAQGRVSSSRARGTPVLAYSAD